MFRINMLQIPVSPPIVILPISILDEVSSLPESKISFRKDLGKMFASDHTGIGQERIELHLAIRTDLTRNMATIATNFQDEARYAFITKLGACKEWTPFLLHKTIAHVVALLSGRIFVGLPLSRNENWIISAIRFTTESLNASEAMQKYPGCVRRLVTPFLPEINRTKRHIARGREFLEPILKELLKSEKHHDDGQATLMSRILKHVSDDLDSQQLTNKMIGDLMVGMCAPYSEIKRYAEVNG
jgi:hypothetical protein